MIAQIHAAHFRIVAQVPRRALDAIIFPLIHDVRAVRYVECFPYVMIRDQHANARSG